MSIILKNVDFFNFLVKRDLIFACAESCTGGMISSQLTSIPGASKVFWGGVVVYSCQAKKTLLNVSENILKQYGAVSGPCTLALAKELARLSQVPLNLAVTGVAGPRQSCCESIGTVWFGLAGAYAPQVLQMKFVGERKSVQLQAARLGRKLSACWWVTKGDLDRRRNLTYI